MNSSDVQGWLDRYVDAWKRNEPGPIESLFTDDAVYRYSPYSSVDGKAPIVEGWIDNADTPDDWEASYEVFAVDDDRAVTIGTTRYFAKGEEPEKLYHNCFLLRFAPDGRCSEFTEYYMLEKKV
ncbi:MAG: nuclear transport factor 2 family protein [Acidimicrobiia bacterium]